MIIAIDGPEEAEVPHGALGVDDGAQGLVRLGHPCTNQGVENKTQTKRVVSLDVAILVML